MIGKDLNRTVSSTKWLLKCFSYVCQISVKYSLEYLLVYYGSVYMRKCYSAWALLWLNIGKASCKCHSSHHFLHVVLLENVSENLQIQGSEVQNSHKAIVKDLADVRHQAQDIYQKIGKWVIVSWIKMHKSIIEFVVHISAILIYVFLSPVAD